MIKTASLKKQTNKPDKFDKPLAKATKMKREDTNHQYQE